MRKQPNSTLNTYTRLTDSFAKNKDINHLIGALQLIPKILEESISKQLNVQESIRGNVNAIQKELKIINGKIEKIDSKLESLDSSYETLADKLDDLLEKINGMNRRLSHIELVVGAVFEALMSKIFIEYLTLKNYNILEKHRNYVIDDEEIDLVIIAEKDSKREHFAVEVKVKPKRSDVGALLSKAELYEAKVGIRPVPVLAGTWIGREVKSYARSKGVIIVAL